MEKKDLKRFIKKLSLSSNILGRDKYFNSAVLVPLIHINNEYHLLFQKRAAQISQGSEICFPGGKYDKNKDKNFKHTAIRESCEELGIDKKKIKVKGSFGTIVAAMGAAIEPFLAIFKIKDIAELTPNKDEVERIFTLPLSYFKKENVLKYKVKLNIHSSYIDDNGKEVVLLPVKELGLPERYEKPWGGKNYNVYLYNTPEGVIWGLTAEIIYEMMTILEKK